MATATTAGGARAAGRPGGNRLAAWLRTREGKITAGAAAALAVVLLALRKGAGSAAAGGFVPSAIQGGPDGTLQSQLDQVGGGGGTLSEWINSSNALAGSVNDLRDLLEAQNPLPPKPPAVKKPAAPRPAPKPPSGGWSLRRIGRVGTPVSLRATAARFSPSKHPDAIESTLRKIVALNPSLKGKTTIPGGFGLKVPK